MFEQIWSLGNSESPCYGIKSQEDHSVNCFTEFGAMSNSTVCNWQTGSTFYGLAQSTSVYSRDLKLQMLKHDFKFYF
jgi:hypothetical protein